MCATLLLLTLAVAAPAGEAPSPFDKAALAWTLPWEADWVTAVTFVGPTRRIAAGNKLGQILLYELPEKSGDPIPQPVRILDGHTNTVTALAATPDGRWLISSSYDHTVRLWDMQAPAKGEASVLLRKAKKSPAKAAVELKLPAQQAARTLDTHKEWVRSLSLSADGKRLLTGDDKGVLILWELPECKEVKRLQVEGWLPAVALSPDAALAATCTFAPRYATFPNAVRIVDVASGAVRHDLGKEKDKAKVPRGVLRSSSAAFSPDGTVLALGEGGENESGNSKIFLYEAASGKFLRELPGHLHGVTAVVFHPDGKHLATCGRDTVVRLWRVADGKAVKELGKGRGGQFRDWLHAASFSADGRWLAAADMAGQVHVWALRPANEAK